MPSEEIRSEYYSAYHGDKVGRAKPAQYLSLYDKYFSDLIDKELSVLELGISDGHSLEYLSKMFPKSRIFGVDINSCERTFSTDRVKMYQGSQDDPDLFQRIMDENKVQQFDIIIDDCSHIGGFTLDSFNILYPFWTPGGLYVIEDWGTGYWPKFPGGKKFQMDSHLRRKKLTSEAHEYLPGGVRFFGECFNSHQYGIPGVLTQLLDEVGMRDAGRGLGLKSSPKIEYLHIYSGIVFIQKTT